MFNVSIFCSSLAETASDGESHQALTGEGDIQGEGVHVVLRLRKLRQECHDTESASPEEIMSLLLILNLKLLSIINISTLKT